MSKSRKTLVAATLSVLAASVSLAPVQAGSSGFVGDRPCKQIIEGSSGVSIALVDDGGTNYCVIEFRGVGQRSWTPPSGLTAIDYLVVAGGGGGGRGWNAASAGGGGAGGVVFGSLGVDSCAALTVTVGAGGAAGIVDLSDDGSTHLVEGEPGGNGGDSILGSVVAIGGGGGGNGRGLGKSGASGGGSGGRTASAAVGTTRPGGTGTIGQGFDGGASLGQTILGGGGGGATGPGATSTAGGAGGSGYSSSITGTSVTYATGGAGGIEGVAAGVSGSSNSGDGGGASSTTETAEGPPGGAGGSGIVVVRYVSDPRIDAAQCSPDFRYDIDIAHYLLPNTGPSWTTPLTALAAGAVIMGWGLLKLSRRKTATKAR